MPDQELNPTRLQSAQIRKEIAEEEETLAARKENEEESGRLEQLIYCFGLLNTRNERGVVITVLLVFAVLLIGVSILIPSSDLDQVWTDYTTSGAHKFFGLLFSFIVFVATAYKFWFGDADQFRYRRMELFGYRIVFDELILSLLGAVAALWLLYLGLVRFVWMDNQVGAPGRETAYDLYINWLDTGALVLNVFSFMFVVGVLALERVQSGEDQTMTRVSQYLRTEVGFRVKDLRDSEAFVGHDRGCDAIAWRPDPRDHEVGEELEPYDDSSEDEEVEDGRIATIDTKRLNKDGTDVVYLVKTRTEVTFSHIKDFSSRVKAMKKHIGEAANASHVCSCMDEWKLTRLVNVIKTEKRETPAERLLTRPLLACAIFPKWERAVALALGLAVVYNDGERLVFLKRCTLRTSALRFLCRSLHAIPCLQYPNHSPASYVLVGPASGLMVVSMTGVATLSVVEQTIRFVSLKALADMPHLSLTALVRAQRMIERRLKSLKRWKDENDKADVVELEPLPKEALPDSFSESDESSSDDESDEKKEEKARKEKNDEKEQGKKEDQKSESKQDSDDAEVDVSERRHSSKKAPSEPPSEKTAKSGASNAEEMAVADVEREQDSVSMLDEAEMELEEKAKAKQGETDHELQKRALKKRMRAEERHREKQDKKADEKADKEQQSSSPLAKQENGEENKPSENKDQNIDSNTTETKDSGDSGANKDENNTKSDSNSNANSNSNDKSEDKSKSVMDVALGQPVPLAAGTKPVVEVIHSAPFPVGETEMTVSRAADMSVAPKRWKTSAMAFPSKDETVGQQRTRLERTLNELRRLRKLREIQRVDRLIGEAKRLGTSRPQKEEKQANGGQRNSITDRLLMFATTLFGSNAICRMNEKELLVHRAKLQEKLDRLEAAASTCGWTEPTNETCVRAIVAGYWFPQHRQQRALDSGVGAVVSFDENNCPVLRERGADASS